MELYKKFEDPSKILDQEEIKYNLEDIFQNDAKKDNETSNLRSILNQIEKLWITRSSNDEPFPLPPDDELVNILFEILNIFNNFQEDDIICFPDSFYYFITYAFQSNHNPKILELILNCVLFLSMFEFNAILIPFFTNLKVFLQSERCLIQLIYIEICINFVNNSYVFEMLKQNNIISEIFQVIQTSGYTLILNRSFEFLTNYLKQFWELNGQINISEELILILRETLLYLENQTRDELISYPLILLDTFFKCSNKHFLEYAKEFNLTSVIQNLINNENPDVFFASTIFLNEHWPECCLFDDSSFYQRFLDIIQAQSESNHEKKSLLEEVQIIAIELLSKLIPKHRDQFEKYKIIESILLASDSFSFQVKEPASLLLMDFLTYSSVETRRNIIKNNSDGTNEIAENAYNLIINSLESHYDECIIRTVVTLILMKNQDFDFWMNFISSAGIIDILINILENSDNERMKINIQSLLNCYYSYQKQE